LREFKGDGRADESGSSNCYIEGFHVAILSYPFGAFVRIGSRSRSGVSSSNFIFNANDDSRVDFDFIVIVARFSRCVPRSRFSFTARGREAA
jgi:hypothetical protein